MEKTRMSITLPMVLCICWFSKFASSAQLGCGSTEFACDNGRCIPNQWTCDHEDDCHDNSDEIRCEHPECMEDQFMCNTISKDCMPLAWKCDGEPDCLDKSDEIGCENKTKSCNSDQFFCGSVDQTCIDAIFICDGHHDCKSGLDESDALCHNRTCREDEYQCDTTKKCISKRWMCDHDEDCKDGSDERNCTFIETCGADQWMCGSNHCIPKKWRCDGSIDCTDKSDELNCSTSVESPTSPKCNPGDFYCKISHECIHQAWVCDADRDCDDETDEESCEHVTCDPDQFQCSSGHCILNLLVCDGIDHCGDDSDEHDCHYECDPHTEFDCRASDSEPHDCIAVSKACDGHDDCGNGRDENGTLCTVDYSSKCSDNNGGCSDICSANRIAFFCSCPAGHKLGPDSKTCEDINECEHPGKCSQICHNTVGSFKCGCHAGYELDLDDESTCRVEGAEPVLIFSNRRDVRQLDLYSERYRSLFTNVQNSIAIDYDFNNRTLYLTDVSSESISKVILDEHDAQVSSQTIASDSISTPDGLALDWIHKNLYWTDTGKNTIEVMSLGGSTVASGRKTLISSDLDEPRAVVVDPREKHRALYWTDWGNKPKIERAFLDGSSRQELISTGIQWPNGLTIDFETNQLFWVDAKLHIIVSSDLEGKNRIVVLTSFVYLAHPFAVAVFENDVYWSDWQAQAILKVNKYHDRVGGNVSFVVKDLTSPMDIHIYHRMTQPEGVNICDQKCSHLCLPRLASPGYTCACPSDSTTVEYTLDSTLRNCLTADTEPKFKPLPDAKGKGFDTTEEDPTKKFNEEKKMSSEKTVKHDHDGHMKIIIISVTSSMFAMIVVLVAICFIRRAYRRRNIKTMNFDNPVYRKTTESEDQITLNKHLRQPTRQISTVLEPLTSTDEYV